MVLCDPSDVNQRNSPDSGRCILETLSDISYSISVPHHPAHEGHLHCCYMKLLATLGTENTTRGIIKYSNTPNLDTSLKAM